MRWTFIIHRLHFNMCDERFLFHVFVHLSLRRFFHNEHEYRRRLYINQYFLTHVES